MKTISEMQTLIKDAYSNLDELSKSLSEYRLSEDKEIEIDFERIKAIGSRNAIYGHILSKADQATKKQYVTLLIALVYFAHENQENGWLIIQRIACGADILDELSDFTIDALNITDKQIDDFSRGISAFDLSEAFILDCMLVYLCCEHKNKKMLDFISLLVELVKCNEQTLKEILSISKLIITQDAEGYFSYCLNKLNIKLSESLCYFLSTRAEIVSSLETATKCKNDHVIIFNADIKNLSEAIELDNFIATDIEFLHCRFENISGIKSENKKIVFRNSIFENITPPVKSSKDNLINLSFMRSETNSLEFDEDFSVIKIRNCFIDSCTFTNCTASLHFVLICNGGISNSVFKNCTAKALPAYKYLIELLGGDITNCKFEKCSIEVRNVSRNSTGIVKLLNGKVSNSIFNECKIYITVYDGIYDSGFYILHLRNSHAESCNFIECNCNDSGRSGSQYNNYIIALQNSYESNNVFNNCLSCQKSFGGIVKRESVGNI